MGNVFFSCYLPVFMFSTSGYERDQSNQKKYIPYDIKLKNPGMGRDDVYCTERMIRI